MKYVKIMNVPLGELLRDEGKVKINWSEYGFVIQDLQRLQFQREYEGNYVQLLPIRDENLATFNSKLETLNNRIDTNYYENDSIEVIDEATALALISTIKESEIGE